MVAERVKLASLQAPPADWEYPSAAREARREWIGRPAVPPNEKKWRGPRLDAEPTDDLPTLVVGISAMPPACGHCGSRFLNTEQPLGQHQRGLITCGRCSRQVCWLLAPITAAAPVRRAERPPSVALQAPAPMAARPVIRPVISGRFNRSDGCSRACTVSYGHDAPSHEQFGRQQALADIDAKPTGLVCTGLLAIDLDAARVFVGGAETSLTPYEYGLLGHLALHVGTVRSNAELTEAVWDSAAAQLWSTPSQHGSFHTLRVHIARLRRKLGQGGRLIETRHGHGYLLRQE